MLNSFFNQFFPSLEVKTLEKEDLKKMLLSAYKKIEENKEEINKINVFPVPDQDTGTNLFKTLEGIKKAIEEKEFGSLEEFSSAVLEGALVSAQGNAGVIYTGFLAGFLPALKNENPLDAQKLLSAFEKGKENARNSIQCPKEGTILDVIEAATSAFKKEVEEGKENIVEILNTMVEKAKEALLRTKEKMEVLKRAGVVDSGGLGFLLILESWLEAIGGKKKEIKTEIKKERRFLHIISNRYEVVSLIRDSGYSEKEIRERLKRFGNSLDIVRIKNMTKIHIHTDYPNRVKNVIRDLGRVEELRIEDMTKEIRGEESVKRVSIGIVTEDVSSLLPKIIERYQIEITNVKFEWPEMEKLEGENVYQKIKEAYRLNIETRPKTSQATPKSYFDAYKRQLERFEKVLCLTLSSKISGCYSSAMTARGMLKEEERERVYVFDTLNAAGSQALLVLRAIELIQEQREIDEIIYILKDLVLKTHLYILFNDPKGIEFIGRITKSQANWIRRMKKLGIYPIIEFKNGILDKGGVIMAKDKVEALFKKVLKESKKERKKGRRIRVVINHTDDLKEAERLKEMLKEIGAEVSFISEGPIVFGAILGPQTLFVSWQAI